MDMFGYSADADCEVRDTILVETNVDQVPSKLEI